MFSGTVLGTDGAPVTARLFATTTCHFQRHTKVKADANPYDPAWWAYFAQRRARRSPYTATVAVLSAQEPSVT